MEGVKRDDEHALTIEKGPPGITTPANATTPSSDNDTLSPFPLSPYGTSTPPDPGFVTPRTPYSVSDSPVSPYVTAALQDFRHMLNSAAPGDKITTATSNEPTGKLWSPLETASVLAHLATFGVLGVLIRYGLGKLFDDIGLVASSKTALFHDLPANMFGCFFMGWVGCVLRKDILHFSEPLSLGLATGLMGSITTFSSWIVKLVMVITEGFWLRGIVGLVVGAELSFMSLIVGMHSAQWLRCLITRFLKPNVAADNFRRKVWSLIIFMGLGVSLWTLFLVLTVVDRESLERRTLWLACVVSPLGVWSRWLLARRNGKGLGKSKRLDWFPWGTLGANLLACIIGYVVSVILLQEKSYDAALWIGAVQIGFLGCLSTVSTLVTEAYNFRNKPWRSYVYVIASVLSAFVLGLFLYSSPVWVKNYNVSI